MARSFRFTSILLALLAFQAKAAELPALAPFEVDTHYGFYWNGVPFGALDFKAVPLSDGYQIEATVQSTGLASIFAPHKSHTTMEAHGDNRIYETYYTDKDEPRHVKIVFDKGTVTETVVEPPEPPEKRAQPTAEELTGALDPLTYVLAVRESLYQALKKDETEFTLRLFEGRRLMDTPYTIIGEEVLRTKAGKQRVIHCKTERVPVAGFSAKELKRLKKSNPSLHILFSQDERLLPVKLYVEVLGRIYAVME